MTVKPFTAIALAPRPMVKYMLLHASFLSKLEEAIGHFSASNDQFLWLLIHLFLLKISSSQSLASVSLESFVESL